jgi:hypothetical protein
MKLKNAAQATALRRSTRVETIGGDRVGGVVQAVQEVEQQRDDDDGDEDGHFGEVGRLRRS